MNLVIPGFVGITGDTLLSEGIPMGRLGTSYTILTGNIESWWTAGLYLILSKVVLRDFIDLLLHMINAESE
jgi:hypothetical protein